MVTLVDVAFLQPFSNVSFENCEADLMGTNRKSLKMTHAQLLKRPRRPSRPNEDHGYRNQPWVNSNVDGYIFTPYFNTVRELLLSLASIF